MFTIGIFFVFAAAFTIAFRRLMRRGIRVESGRVIDDRNEETAIVHLDQLDSLLMHLSPVVKEPELKGFRRTFLWTVTAKSGESEIEFYEDDFGSEMLMSQILGPSHLAHFRKAEPDQASGKRTYWAPPVLSLSGAGVLLLQLLIRLWLERTPDPTSITLNWLALLVLLIPSLASWITLDEDRFQWWIMGIPVTVMR